MFLDRKTNIIMTSILPRLACKFNIIPIEIPTVFFFLEFNKLILKFIWKSKKVKNSQDVLI